MAWSREQIFVLLIWVIKSCLFWEVLFGFSFFTSKGIVWPIWKLIRITNHNILVINAAWLFRMSSSWFPNTSTTNCWSSCNLPWSLGIFNDWIILETCQDNVLTFWSVSLLTLVDWRSEWASCKTWRVSKIDMILVILVFYDSSTHHRFHTLGIWFRWWTLDIVLFTIDSILLL